jgi:hypothetical protein
MRINAVTKDVTETPKRSTAAKNTGVVLCRKASLHPADFAPIFSRILLSTCMKDDHATTVMAATKLKTKSCW